MFYSGGCDYHAIKFDIKGDIIKEWSISPLPTSITSVNPPFIFSITRSERDGMVYCGCGDGSIRVLDRTGDRYVIQPHGYSISKVCVESRFGL